MRQRQRFSAVVAVALGGAASAADDGPRLGRPLAPAVAHAHVSVVFPDGHGLPPGQGSVHDGARLYAARCRSCHGVDGRGGPGGELAGGRPDLTAAQPDQTIGTYWPYATTVFDFIRRAMPMDAPWSLGDDEVYALTAYLLHLNGILPATAVLDAAALAAVRMPNADGFDAIEAPGPPR
ncbi:MAG: c-type cytochrome [Gammaproteobacteria bacterium]